MPVSRLGQMITFSIETDEDQRFKKFIWIDVKIGDTIARIAGRRGHPEDGRQIAKLNGIRSTRQVLRHSPRKKGDVMRIRVPGELQASAVFSVLAGAEPPRVVSGYQKLETTDRPLRTGITKFAGYDPIQMEIPIQFESFRDKDGERIERDISLLERMAGRGAFRGAAVGPAPIIRISTTGPTGSIVMLMPPNYQYSSANPGPLWRVGNIDWDSAPLRDKSGNRIRQAAVVTVHQDTHVAFKVRSAAERSRRR